MSIKPKITNWGEISFTLNRKRVLQEVLIGYPRFVLHGRCKLFGLLTEFYRKEHDNFTEYCLCFLGFSLRLFFQNVLDFPKRQLKSLKTHFLFANFANFTLGFAIPILATTEDKDFQKIFLSMPTGYNFQDEDTKECHSLTFFGFGPAILLNKSQDIFLNGE